jgi:hypothetical protein
VLDEQIGFRLEERSRQVRHVPTPAELKEEKRLSYRPYQAYDYMATGEKVETLKKHRDAWHESHKLRAFIYDAYKSRPFDPESPFAKWLVWASLQADRRDPLKEGPPSVMDYDRSHW